MALRMDGKDEKRMGQDKEKNRLGRKSRTASSKLGYGFLSNAAWHWREQFTREPKAAVSVLLLSFVAISLPLLNARLPKLVLQGAGGALGVEAVCGCASAACGGAEGLYEKDAGTL